MNYTFDEAVKRWIADYEPKDEREASDKEQMLAFCMRNRDAFERENTTAHFSASSWIVNDRRDSALMVYHNIYRSWSWTGGHADGDTDLLVVALREAEEETGVRPSIVSRDPISLETITVRGHIKRGNTVSAHLHLNVTFLFEADMDAPLRVKEDENSGIMWIPFSEIPTACTEEEMQPIYAKLMAIAEKMQKEALIYAES